MVIERRQSRQRKLTKSILKCACHSAHFSHWKVAESRISAKTEMWDFSCDQRKLCDFMIRAFHTADLQNILSYLFNTWAGGARGHLETWRGYPWILVIQIDSVARFSRINPQQRTDRMDTLRKQETMINQQAKLLAE